jgi:D-hydroxyproline dehydrogenase subunit beta
VPDAPAAPPGALPPVPGTLPATADAIVIGAGIVGAAVAARLSAGGRTVCVIDRSSPLGGTSAAGEGNILVSDKLPGPELALALRSDRLWREFAAAHGSEFEFEAKGGVVVAHDQAQLDTLEKLAEQQRAATVQAATLDGPGLRAAEPAISPHLAGGVLYPQDCQVQPMRAVMAYLTEAREHGCTVVAQAAALAAITAPAGVITGVVTNLGVIAAPLVVNAAGPWSAEVASALGSALPVRPRRGRVLVTEPLPPLVRHKVYEADYVGAVASDAEDLACSAVVESTPSGTVLIGSSREFTGFSGRIEMRVLSEIARRAISVFPFLGRVRAIRAYGGFRPASPDHLPIIGPDAVIPGLYHATGHEGAGVGLAPATAELLGALIDEKVPPVDPAPFAPGRFTASRFPEACRDDR